MINITHKHYDLSGISYRHKNAILAILWTFWAFMGVGGISVLFAVTGWFIEQTVPDPISNRQIIEETRLCREAQMTPTPVTDIANPTIVIRMQCR